MSTDLLFQYLPAITSGILRTMFPSHPSQGGRGVVGKESGGVGPGRGTVEETLDQFPSCAGL